jgi:hypothetical protein
VIETDDGTGTAADPKTGERWVPISAEGDDLEASRRIDGACRESSRGCARSTESVVGLSEVTAGLRAITER